MFTLIVTVPVANKRDTRSIEEAMNEIRAKKRQKKGEEEGAGSGSGVWEPCVCVCVYDQLGDKTVFYSYDNVLHEQQGLVKMNLCT